MGGDGDEVWVDQWAGVQGLATTVGGLCALGACCVSLPHFLGVLNSRSPDCIKICILQIVFMVLLYALEAWFSLRHAHDPHHWPMVLTFIREFYEAVVLVAFLNLVLNCLNGSEQVAKAFAEEMQKPEHPFCLKRIPTIFEPGQGFLVALLCGLLQFAGIMVVVTLLGIAFWVYRISVMADPTHAPFKRVEVVMKTLKAASCGYAMYVLSLFYVEIMRNPRLKERFESIYPERKFLAIKGVIFFTIIQNFVCTSAAKLGFLDGIPLVGTATGQATPSEVGETIQNTLICVEMLFFSVAHLLAYPIKEFDEWSIPDGIGHSSIVAMLKDMQVLIRQAQTEKRMIRRLAEDRPLAEEEALLTFEAFDLDNDGAISKKEFEYMLQMAHFSWERIEALLKRADHDGDDMVSKAEFMKTFALGC